MALRSTPAFGVATTGPRSRAVGASQWIGKRLTDPLPGCEVSRMCDVLLPDMELNQASRINKALPPARRRRAFEIEVCSRSLGMASVTTLLSAAPADLAAGSLACPGPAPTHTPGG